MHISQDQINNLYFETVADANVAGRNRNICFIKELDCFYKYEQSTAVVDSYTTLTARQSTHRWVRLGNILSSGLPSSHGFEAFEFTGGLISKKSFYAGVDATTELLAETVYTFVDGLLESTITKNFTINIIVTKTFVFIDGVLTSKKIEVS